MALKPEDQRHARQILAGTEGRLRGHDLEKRLASDITSMRFPLPEADNVPIRHLVEGHPATEVIRYIIRDRGLSHVSSTEGFWLGGLATSGQGDLLVLEGGEAVVRSKSDVVAKIRHPTGFFECGVSVKTCSGKTPTNDQLYFTTAVAFCSLLRRHGILVSSSGEKALRMFCGDPGFRPPDMPQKQDHSNPERWFWEELPLAGRNEWETLLQQRQSEITLVLLQKAYPDDPFWPQYLVHQTHAFSDYQKVPLAIFSIEELVLLSLRHRGFETRPYRIRKGRFKDDPNTHYAPRFGIIQFQRGGQRQHPTQLQFNLEAGYFNKLPY